MKLEVFYENGRYYCFDTENLCDSTPWKNDNGMTNHSDMSINNIVPAVSFDLKLDEVITNLQNKDMKDENKKGLVLVINYWTINLDEDVRKYKFTERIDNENYYSIDIPFAKIYSGRAIEIVSYEKLKEISSIKLDGETVLERIIENNVSYLINTLKFNQQINLKLPSENNSFNKNIVELVNYIKTSNKDNNGQCKLTDAQICNSIGVPFELYKQILVSEYKQMIENQSTKK